MLIEQMLDRYFKGQLTPEEKERLFRAISNDPSLEDTILTLLKDVDPEKARQFLSEKSLMCDTEVLPEADEALIEMFLSGMMSDEEESAFKERLLSDEDFQTNALARAFLFKAIKKIREEDSKVLESARSIEKTEFEEMLGLIRDGEDDELIERYVNDALSKEEKASFEARMATDERFKERVMTVAMLDKSIIEEQRKTSQALEDAAKLSREDVISVIKKERADETGAVPIWTKIRRVAAVAAVVVVAAGVFDFSNSSGMRGLAGENIQYAMSGISAPSRGGISEAEESVLNDLKTLFECVGDKDCVDESTVSRLRKYYDMATDGAVDFEDTYIDQISLAMATAYIYTGQKGKAKEVLRETIGNPDVSGDARSRAEKLLKKTRMSFVF